MLIRVSFDYLLFNNENRQIRKRCIFFNFQSLDLFFVLNFLQKKKDKQLEYLNFLVLWELNTPSQLWEGVFNSRPHAEIEYSNLDIHFLSLNIILFLF